VFSSASGIDPTQNLIVALTRPHLLRPSSPPSRPEFHSDPRTGPTLFPADHPSQAASPPSSPSSSNGAVADFETRLPTPPGYELHLLDLQGRPRMDIARHCLDLTIDEWDAENSWLARCCIQICESTVSRSLSFSPPGIRVTRGKASRYLTPTILFLDV
jgi:hypothetical protein